MVLNSARSFVGSNRTSSSTIRRPSSSPGWGTPACAAPPVPLGCSRSPAASSATVMGKSSSEIAVSPAAPSSACGAASASPPPTTPPAASDADAIPTCCVEVEPGVSPKEAFASSSTAPIITWKNTVSVRRSTWPVLCGSKCRHNAARSFLASSSAQLCNSEDTEPLACVPSPSPTSPRTEPRCKGSRGGRAQPKLTRKSSSAEYRNVGSAPVAASKEAFTCLSSICQ
mmetsp:Transcript_53064/g.147718  ORF Transcript_53064/g.147718 Transcript_53064/m.147718 type:complete len:228 (+) Transcript_53064:715-1398(+)